MGEKMIVFFVRLIVVYITTVIFAKFLGKRQIGELQTSEIITAFFLSELATYTVTNKDIPLIFGLIGVFTTVALEVMLSYISIKCPFIKNIFHHKESYLIKKGVFSKEEFKKCRIAFDEFLSQMRISQIDDISSIYYAVLEPDGKISFILKEKYKSPTLDDLNIKKSNSGIIHSIIEDGIVNKISLKQLNKTQEWLNNILKTNELSLNEITLLTCDDNDKIYYVKKSKK